MKTVTYDEKIYKLVPIEPTEDMCQYGRKRFKEIKFPVISHKMYHSFKAMLEAAPEYESGLPEIEGLEEAILCAEEYERKERELLNQLKELNRASYYSRIIDFNKHCTVVKAAKAYLELTKDQG